METHAVVFTYSFDNDSAVYLLNSEDEAKEFLWDAYSYQMQSAKRDEQRHSGSISEDGVYAKISMDFEDEDSDVTEIRVARLFR